MGFISLVKPYYYEGVNQLRTNRLLLQEVCKTSDSEDMIIRGIKASQMHVLPYLRLITYSKDLN